jgi:hypothetical protein
VSPDIKLFWFAPGHGFHTACMRPVCAQRHSATAASGLLLLHTVDRLRWAAQWPCRSLTTCLFWSLPGTAVDPSPGPLQAAPPTCSSRACVSNLTPHLLLPFLLVCMSLLLAVMSLQGCVVPWAEAG